MQYRIFGDHLPAVTIKLEAGESIITQSGGLAWMTDSISLETNMRGGFMKSLARAFSGDSMFIATYTATKENQEITLSSTLPGEIIAFDLDGTQEYIGQKGTFLGASDTVEINTHVVKGLAAGLFGGEGFILQRFSGEGTLFAEMDGAIEELDLQSGQVLKVDSGHVAMFESRVEYDIETVKGFKNILFGGEGLFLTTLTGPGKVWLQTMTARDLANRIIPFIPTGKVSSSSSD